jgi:aryl-phospho-beta-D-glucosidase BglC (GH1 family)
MMGLCWTAARELHREALKSDLGYVRTAVACALAMGILVLLDPHGFAEELRSVRREAP